MRDSMAALFSRFRSLTNARNYALSHSVASCDPGKPFAIHGKDRNTQTWGRRIGCKTGMGLPPVPLLRLFVERLLPCGPGAALADGARCGVHAGPPAGAAADGARPRQGPACMHPHDVGPRQYRTVAVRSVLAIPQKQAKARMGLVEQRDILSSRATRTTGLMSSRARKGIRVGRGS